jgi:ribose 1,5-bisphosphokinase
MRLHSVTNMPEGRLVLVVGPSGAGKDSLIEAAMADLAHDARFHFPKREVTRPHDAGGEDHIAVSVQEFAARKAAGGYALAWDAHGLHYGIPIGINALLASGDTVVINTSRTVIRFARATYDNLRIIYVTAPVAILAQRIAARGRESAEDVVRRMDRAGIAAPAGDDVVSICNDGSLGQAAKAFVSALIHEQELTR